MYKINTFHNVSVDNTYKLDYAVYEISNSNNEKKCLIIGGDIGINKCYITDYCEMKLKYLEEYETKNLKKINIEDINKEFGINIEDIVKYHKEMNFKTGLDQL